MKKSALLTQARLEFHTTILAKLIKVDSKGVPSNADKDSRSSVQIASGIAERLGVAGEGVRLAGQMAGNRFEEICANYLGKTFLQLGHLRPGLWEVKRSGGRNRLEIAKYEQYAHLIALESAAKKDPQLAAALGSDYTITRDIIVLREPEEDESINKPGIVVDRNSARLASLRKANNDLPILHASISCKWTLRSDRAQNARAEALNLVRNRKGRLPHIAVVTGEPLPSRIASLSLGTGRY
jgi:hypothetical protein